MLTMRPILEDSHGEINRKGFMCWTQTEIRYAKDAYAEYRKIKEENKELQMTKHNLERFLNQQEEEQKQKEKQQSKSGQSL